jgi:neutral ceramidase
MSAVHSPPRYRAGFAKRDITIFDPELALFGWGCDTHRARGVTLPLFARAMVLDDGAQRLAYVVCDLGMISESLRDGVVRALHARDPGWTDDNVLLTATHTHSGPSGYSSYLLPSLAGPGRSDAVRDALVREITRTIEEAAARREPARLWLHDEWVPVSEPVAFNRSIDAFNRNCDATPVTSERSDEAVDRTMRVLRVDAVDGRPLGLVSWFAVHGTSVHADHEAIHGDNKGYAAKLLEERMAEHADGFVAAFAQESAGDVSPNYREHRGRGRTVGRYDDDDESARFAGAIQARYAAAAWSAAPRRGRELEGALTVRFRREDFFDFEADPRFVGEPTSREDLTTHPPLLGVSFTFGTREGPGPLRSLQVAHPALERGYRVAYGGERAAGGLHVALLPPDRWSMAQRMVASLALPFLSSRTRRAYAQIVRRSASTYWVPRHLPFQLVRIGALAIAAMPHEVTTQAGRRIRKALTTSLGSDGPVVVSAYSNAYCGYLTTPEEYDARCYEGAMNLYGRASLAAVITALARLARAPEAQRVARLEADAWTERAGVTCSR